jgi:hypothetical protein
MLSDLQKHYVEAVERLAEGKGTTKEVHRLLVELAQEEQQPGFFEDLPLRYANCATRSFSSQPSRYALCELFRQITFDVTSFAEDRVRIWQCQLIREIFGNPFRPVSLNPAWLTSDVRTIAAQMYESRDFGAMPILADALEDAGCDNVNVLDHCREPGEHVRGCWVIDIILKK